MFKYIREARKRYTWVEIIRYLDAFYGLGALETLLATNWVNPLLTLYVNFRSVSLKHAWKLPIFVYGWPRVYSLSGCIKFEDTTVRPGMVKFNIVTPGDPGHSTQNGEINNKGEVIFHGTAVIKSGTALKTSYGASLEIGDNFLTGTQITITTSKSVVIGKNTRIAHNTQIIDSNYHFLANIQKRTIAMYMRPIHIGSNCWIGNTSTISAGAVLPDFSIVTSNSVLNKNFRDVKPFSLFGGIPAKLLNEGSLVRVNNPEVIRDIFNHYNNSTEPYAYYEAYSPEYLGSFK